MQLGIRSRVFLVTLGLAAIIGLIAGVVLEVRLRADLLERAESELFRTTAVLDGHLSQVASAGDPADIDEGVDRIASSAEVRLTAIAEDGRVIGESTLDGSELAAMDNHADRPEVERARRRGEGTARRRSSTVRADMLYVAQRTTLADGTVVLLRAARPLSEIDAAVWSLRFNLLLSAGLALLAALISATLVSTWMQSTLERLVDRARVLQGASDAERPRTGSTQRATVQQLSDRLERALQELAAERDQVRALERVRRDFVSNVSHELRTPVAIVAATTETLLGGAIDDPEAARPFTEAVHRHAVRLGRLVDELLSLSRIESGRMPMNPAVLQLGPVVRRLAQVQAEAAPDRAPVEVQVPDDLSVWVDRDAFEHAVGNLLENAVKYVPAEAAIHVQARREGDRVRVQVIDEGPGIDPEHAERVFERFYRVDAGRSRELGGTGLGLSLVRHLAEAMNGHVRLRANEPHGCIFTLDLPAEAPGAG